MNITELRQILERKKGKRDSLLQQFSDANTSWKEATLLAGKLEQARTIIKTVALQTQRELEYHINSITTSALEAVFPDPYEFKLEFVERGEKTEADAYFLKNGEQIDPMSGSGGGAVDIAAFSLRASVWRLKPSRAVLILDEPFRFLSRDLQPRAAEMLKEISKKLKLQIIMVTHNEDLLECADKVFMVKQKNGIARVSSNGDIPEKKVRVRVR